MSERTVLARKAVLEAWKHEQQLVDEGKGTYEWTREQQQSIHDVGIAYDENGYAFQGHHMLSVEKYPEYQGDYKNIQFLSKDDHLKAHNGWYGNPTNWYYDPKTGDKELFEEGQYRPCTIIYLKDPVFPPKDEISDHTEPTDNTIMVEAETEPKKKDINETISEKKDNCREITTTPSTQSDDYGDLLLPEAIAAGMRFDLPSYYASKRRPANDKKRGKRESKRYSRKAENEYEYETPLSAGLKAFAQTVITGVAININNNIWNQIDEYNERMTKGSDSKYSDSESVASLGDNSTSPAGIENINKGSTVESKIPATDTEHSSSDDDTIKDNIAAGALTTSLHGSPASEADQDVVDNDSHIDNVNRKKVSGYKMPPHTRRGHNHPYRIGPRNGERVYIVKWLDDIHVNQYMLDDDSDTDD